jgi:hypothetical protein
MSRKHSTQKEQGQYCVLWADIDKDTKPIIEVQKAIEGAGMGQHEIYTTSSATPDNQKCRVLIPLLQPLDFETWTICQEILNDILIKNGITPDKVNVRAGQLCYLPNKSEFYESLSNRTGEVLDAKKAFTVEIDKKKLAIVKVEKEIEEKRLADEKRKSKPKSGEDLIGAFNHQYEVGEILIQARYEQKGNTYRHPESTSGSYGATVKDERVHSLNENDPLYSDGKGSHDAFSAFTVLLHQGDGKKAIKDAGDNWLKIGDESWNKVRQREWKRGQVGQKLNTMANNEDSQKLALEIDKKIEVLGVNDNVGRAEILELMRSETDLISLKQHKKVLAKKLGVAVGDIEEEMARSAPVVEIDYPCKALLEFNKHHYVINLEGQTKLVYMKYNDVTGSHSYGFSTIADSEKYHSHKKAINPKGQYARMMDVFMDYKARPTYKGAYFKPIPMLVAQKGEMPSPTGREGLLNLYRGLAYKPVAGDHQLILDHILEVWCDGKETLYDYVIGWLARMFQFPNLQGETGIVLQSGEGTGKNIIIDMLIRVYGNHGCVAI